LNNKGHCLGGDGWGGPVEKEGGGGQSKLLRDPIPCDLKTCDPTPCDLRTCDPTTCDPVPGESDPTTFNVVAQEVNQTWK